MAPGKLLMIAGVILLVAGLLIENKGGVPLLGRLPGDIHIERENFSIFLPLGSCLLISALVSLIMWLFRR